MIILNGMGAAWGLPETSPFVTKTEVQLKMAGLDYEKRRAMPQDGPKGQLPFIDDGGRLIGDSTFIRFHIEQEYGVDLDAGLSPVERATALAIELMAERDLVQPAVFFRWLDSENFAKGPAHIFDSAPEAAREQIRRDVLAKVREAMLARGVARHTQQEITALAVRGLKAVDVLLGDKAFVMGDQPTAVDAMVFAALAASMTPFFASPVREHAVRAPRLVAYVSRMMDRFYPDFEWDVGPLGVERQAA